MNALKRSVKTTKNTTSKTNNVKLPKINRSRNNINDSVIKEDPSEDNQDIQDKTSIQKVSTDNNKTSVDNLAQDSQMEAYSEISDDNLLSQKRLVKNATTKTQLHNKKDRVDSKMNTPRGENKSKHVASSMLSTEASRNSNMKKRAKSELRMRNMFDNLSNDDTGGMFLFD